MDRTERVETTDYATKKINSFLENHEYLSALLLASIYVNIRLRSLLTNRLSPPKNEWKKISQALDSVYGFKKMVSLCDKLELIPTGKPRILKSLWDKRSKVAHESTLWKEEELSDDEKKKITNLCKCAITFLQQTNF